jgi:hypothetical protein
MDSFEVSNQLAGKLLKTSKLDAEIEWALADPGNGFLGARRLAKKSDAL